MRRGSTLIEMTATLGVAVIVFAGAVEGIVRLQRLAAVDTVVGTRAELACALLRRDLAAGLAHREGAGLRIAATRPVLWRVEDGQLLRDGQLQVAVTAFAVEETAGGLVVTVSPTGLPARRIEVLP